MSHVGRMQLPLAIVSLETRVFLHLGMPRGESPRHAQNPLHIGRAKESTWNNPPCPSPNLTSSSVHHSFHQRTALFLSYYNVP